MDPVTGRVPELDAGADGPAVPVVVGEEDVVNDALEVMLVRLASSPRVEIPCRACPVGNPFTCVSNVFTRDVRFDGNVIPESDRALE